MSSGGERSVRSNLTIMAPSARHLREHVASVGSRRVYWRPRPITFRCSCLRLPEGPASVRTPSGEGASRARSGCTSVMLRRNYRPSIAGGGEWRVVAPIRGEHCPRWLFRPPGCRSRRSRMKSRPGGARTPAYPRVTPQIVVGRRDTQFTTPIALQQAIGTPSVRSSGPRPGRR